MVKKIVVDSNILISALGWKGYPRRLFEKIIDKKVELFISPEIIKEVRRVMNYPKFGFTEEEKTKFLTILMKVSNIVKPKGKLM